MLEELAAGSTMSASATVSVGNGSATSVNRSSRVERRAALALARRDAAMLMFQQTSARDRAGVRQTSAKSMCEIGGGRRG